MKFKTLLAASALTFFVSLSSASAAVSIAVNQSGSTQDGVGAFVFEVLEVQLAGKPDHELVDRKRLQDMLAEQSLAASGLTNDQAAKIGKLVGAKYYVFGEARQSGERTAINCRVVQVETGVLKPVLLIVPNTEDPMKAGDELATKVSSAIAQLEGRNAEPQAAAPSARLELAADTKRPSFAFRIPEVSVTPQANTADPAAEKSLESFLLASDCKLVQLSRPSQSASASNRSPVAVAAGSHLEGKEHEELLNEARTKGVDVLILGIATSERAAQIGQFNAARSRVELAAVRVSDSRVLATTSGYGVGTDLSNFIAEKKAIESATEKLRTDFTRRIITAYNAPAGK